MTSSAPASPQATHDVTALIAAVARNTEAGGLHKFLELYRKVYLSAWPWAPSLSRACRT